MKFSHSPFAGADFCGWREEDPRRADSWLYADGAGVAGFAGTGFCCRRLADTRFVESGFDCGAGNPASFGEIADGSTMAADSFCEVSPDAPSAELAEVGSTSICAGVCARSIGVARGAIESGAGVASMVNSRIGDATRAGLTCTGACGAAGRSAGGALSTSE